MPCLSLSFSFPFSFSPLVSILSFRPYLTFYYESHAMQRTTGALATANLRTTSFLNPSPILPYSSRALLLCLSLSFPLFIYLSLVSLVQVHISLSYSLFAFIFFDIFASFNSFIFSNIHSFSLSFHFTFGFTIKKGRKRE